MTKPIEEQMYDALINVVCTASAPVALLLTHAAFHYLRGNVDSHYHRSLFSGVPVHVIPGLRNCAVLFEDGTTRPI